MADLEVGGLFLSTLGTAPLHSLYLNPARSILGTISPPICMHSEFLAQSELIHASVITVIHVVLKQLISVVR